MSTARGIVQEQSDSAPSPSTFRGVDQVPFSCRTKTDAAAALLPADLEVAEDPEVSVMFLSYAFSSVGPFREPIHIIHAGSAGRTSGSFGCAASPKPILSPTDRRAARRGRTSP